LPKVQYAKISQPPQILKPKTGELKFHEKFCDRVSVRHKMSGVTKQIEGAENTKSTSGCRRLSVIARDFEIANADRASRTINQIVT
jgi:hypothetical protein